MKARLWIWSAVAILAVVVVGLWIRSNLVEREETFYVGFHGQARSNPTFAAQRVLERLEISARSRPGFPDNSRLSGDDATECLIAPIGSLPDNPGSIAALKKWVAHGGVLITGLPGGRSAQPRILSPEFKKLLGVQGWETVRQSATEALGVDEDNPLTEQEEKKQQQEEQDSQEMAKLFEQLFSRETELKLPWASDPVSVSTASRWRIRPDPHTVTLDTMASPNALAIGHEIGDGWIIVLADYDLLNNRNLSRAANATFLHQACRDASDVTFVYGWDSPTLSEYLWEKQRPILTALTCLLVVGLASASRRFGPIKPTPAAHRRELLEHIRAAGLNLFRHGGRGSLALALRRRIRQRACLLHPGWSQLGDEALARELAQHAGFDTDRLVRAMTAPVTTREELVETASTLHLLRQALGPTR